ncbi:hypothetical protein FJTKL_14347 [Diaporthe vaccinii]|uniref:Rrn9 domain-containing protein n=1 Tax=Diaporthe vaccinii TaxID=105482 RepID=A0ABR4E868_9PEZI
MAPGDFEIIGVADQDTPTTAEIINSSDTDIISKPEESRPFKNAASRPSPTHARHHDQLFSKTRANFVDGPSSELSSPFTDFDTTHSRSDAVPLHFTTPRVDKMGRPPSLGSADIMAGETVESYYNDDSDGIPDYILEAGMRSPSARIHDDWADRPVGYVPATWPTGPRMLASGHYTCPHEGCEYPVGSTKWGNGYSRTTLAPHILSHGIDRVRLAVRDRVMLMRYHQGRSRVELTSPYDYCKYVPGDLQRATDDMILDLEELKNWEQGDRFVRPWPWLARPGTDDDESSRDMLRCELRKFLRDDKHDPFDAAVEADDESVPHQNSKGFRDNRFRQARDASSKMRREEMGSSPLCANYFKPIIEQFQTPSSTQDMDADTDSSHGPPRKKARKLRRQPEDPSDDYVPRGGEDRMELD